MNSLNRIICIVVAMTILSLAFKSVVQAQERPSKKMWCEYPAAAGPGNGKHVVLVAGDDEYRSEEALPMLGKILARRHGFKCTVLFPVNEKGVIQPNFQKNIPGMSVLDSADLVILGLRFRDLPDEQMEYFDRYIDSGKPILGIRTSTHAFRIQAKSEYGKYSYNSKAKDWIGGFGRRVLGDTWISHHGVHGSQSTRGVVNSRYSSHPVLKGVKDVWGPTDVYGITHLPDTAQVLLHGQVIAGMKPTDAPVDGKKNDPMMPLAWVSEYKTSNGTLAKVFCTTMGAATDFESADLRRLLVNAVYWGLGLDEAIKADSDVAFVDPFKPSPFGFGSFVKERRPEFYDLKNK